MAHNCVVMSFLLAIQSVLQLDIIAVVKCIAFVSLQNSILMYIYIYSWIIDYISTLTLSILHAKRNTFAHSVDPNKSARHELSHRNI